MIASFWFAESKKYWWLHRQHMFYLSLGAAPHHSLKKLLDLIIHIKFCLIQFSLAYFTHMLCCCSLRLNSVVQRINHLLWCLCWCMSRCVFLVHLASFRLSFFFVCLCRPTLFSFQFHVIAIVTLACTLLGHHWSMLTGRYNLIGSLRDKRKCVMSWGTFTPLIHRHSNLNFFVLRAVWL